MDAKCALCHIKAVPHVQRFTCIVRNTGGGGMLQMLQPVSPACCQSVCWGLEGCSAPSAHRPLSPSQGDFTAAGRRSHENSSLDSVSPSFSHTHTLSTSNHWCLFCSYDAKPVFSRLPLPHISVIADGNQGGHPVHPSDRCANIQI